MSQTQWRHDLKRLSMAVADACLWLDVLWLKKWFALVTLISLSVCRWIFLGVQWVSLWIVAFPGHSHWFLRLAICSYMAACSLCLSSFCCVVFFVVSRYFSQCQYMTKPTEINSRL